MKKIRVGAVNYRNAKPLLFGLEQPEMTELIELSYDYPARLAEQLKSGQIDVGLLPVAAIPGIAGAHVVSDYGIAADGKVASVALFSRVPIEQVKTIILDYQSRTSVALLRILVRDYWKMEVNFISSTGDGYINEIKGDTAGLIIGDRALQNLDRFFYVYDLAEAWKSMTGMPFVFAAWVSTASMDPGFIAIFNKANAKGLDHLEALANDWALPGVDMFSYYQDRICYKIDSQKSKGLERFLAMLGAGVTV